MIETCLFQLLNELAELRRKVRWWRMFAIGCFVTACIVIVRGLLRPIFGEHLPATAWILLAGFVLTLAALLIVKRRGADLRSVVIELEGKFPDAHPALSTALEQKPDPKTGTFGFLQQRVINEVLSHPERVSWEEYFRWKLVGARVAAVVAFVALFFSAAVIAVKNRSGGSDAIVQSVIVDPGNIEIERGSGLVVSARFNRNPPAEAALVLVTASGKTNRLALERHLADPVFGTSLLEVSEDAAYHIEYTAKRTDDYRIKVFEYPALRRADATLNFPAYTGLTNKTIPDTLRVSAVEGSRLSYRFELNKPVAQARLVGKRGTFTLAASTNAFALLNELPLTNSDRYALQLIDLEGRTNKISSEIVVQVLPNRRPDLKVTFPHGDQRVSSVQELTLQAEASDDFGLLKYGFGFGVAGQEAKIVECGQRADANAKRDFQQTINLESLGVKVGDLFSYFVWVDDFGADGAVRRTFSDMFFAEVRPYEEVFRPDQSGGGEEGNEGQNGNQSTRLTELQKQIVIATWKIQREKGGKP